MYQTHNEATTTCTWVKTPVFAKGKTAPKFKIRIKTFFSVYKYIEDHGQKRDLGPMKEKRAKKDPYSFYFGRILPSTSPTSFSIIESNLIADL